MRNCNRNFIIGSNEACKAVSSSNQRWRMRGSDVNLRRSGDRPQSESPDMLMLVVVRIAKEPPGSAVQIRATAPPDHFVTGSNIASQRSTGS
eukprot:10038181-Heterocapsa_arctica.AAC.1